MDSNSDSDESGGRPLEWEILSSSDANFSDSNGNGHDGEVHEQGVALHLQHFDCPPEITTVSQIDEGLLQQQQQQEQQEQQQQQQQDVSSKDWVEPSSSQQHQQQQFKEEQHDKEALDMFSSLVSSVLDEGKRDRMNTGEGDASKAEDSLANLQREILSESGFSSLVPSDVHGNVVNPEDEASTTLEDDDELDEGAAAAAEGGDMNNGSSSSSSSSSSSMSSYCKLKSLARTIRRASTLWSLTIAAAALMGLVIIGRQWNQERWQNQQLRLQLCYKDEKISQLLFQIARLKDAVSGRRRVAVVRSASSM